MAQDLTCNCRMVYNSAVVAVLVLFAIVPITGQQGTNNNGGAGLDPAFVNDPFHSPNTYPNNANQPQNPYHYNSDPYPSAHQPQYPQYPYNNNPAPSNQYQYNSYPNQNAGSYQYAQSTTVSPVPTPVPTAPQVPSASSGAGEEYEQEDGNMPGSSAPAYSPSLSRHAPAQYNWYYGNYGGGKTGNYRTGGLLEALRPQQRYYQQQQPRTNFFNQALPMLFALNAW